MWQYDESSDIYELTTPKVYPDRRNINGKFIYDPKKGLVTFFYKEINNGVWTGRYIASETIEFDGQKNRISKRKWKNKGEDEIDLEVKEDEKIAPAFEYYFDLLSDIENLNPRHIGLVRKILDKL